MSEQATEPEVATECVECEEAQPVTPQGRIVWHETPFGTVGEPHPMCSGSGLKPLERKDYVVRGSISVMIRIKGAKSADAAADEVEYSDGGLDITYDGIDIDEVISADKADDYDADDERTHCENFKCTHLLSSHHGRFDGPKNPDGSRVHPHACARYGCECEEPLVLKPYLIDDEEEPETEEDDEV
jgi:hypothetical protein